MLIIDKDPRREWWQVQDVPPFTTYNETRTAPVIARFRDRDDALIFLRAKQAGMPGSIGTEVTA